VSVSEATIINGHYRLNIAILLTSVEYNNHYVVVIFMLYLLVHCHRGQIVIW